MTSSNTVAGAKETSLAINFTGLTHDHNQAANGAKHEEQGGGEDAAYCSAIAILRRHPMYDCLILVKKYRNCLQAYSLEFPLDKVRDDEMLPTSESPRVERQRPQQQQQQHGHQQDSAASCSGRRLVSRFLDGDDPIFGGCCNSQLQQGASCPGASSDQSTTTNSARLQQLTNGDYAVVNPFAVDQVDDRGAHCELVHVPVNGLLDRLAGYTRQGIAVDSRVYAFAMGLKTAERIMTTKSMKELQESPI